jgi:hypothetical protein
VKRRGITSLRNQIKKKEKKRRGDQEKLKVEEKLLGHLSSHLSRSVYPKTALLKGHNALHHKKH